MKTMQLARALLGALIGLGIIAGVLIVYTVWFIRKKAPQIII